MSCPIVLASDEAYGMPLATALRSIVDANQRWWPLDIHILAFGVSTSTRSRISRSLPNGAAELHWISIEQNQFDGLWTQDHISRATYARLLIPELFPESAPKVLYLDSDILVLGELAPLWDTDLGDAAVGAVLDGLDAQIKSGTSAVNDIPRVEHYFNAGVLLINLPKWRERRISERALQYLEQNPKSPFSDQDALNVACNGAWKKLDPRWNFIDHYERTDIQCLAPERRPGIVHFATWRKPWNAKALSVNSAFFDSFRKRTQFARSRLDISRDALRASWSLTKRGLRQFPAVRTVIRVVVRP
ncbi:MULTISPECIES: glycosyltransferase family 8 protein [unclassified Bradyrhizobium]|uniref:glycosyltransferase family 8 protein n=1 Tax=unclassified Bradyrhizobium TaxID=2631580 RepID=UPI002112D0F5|nr:MULTISPECIES: glycosyltransferase family 8 protein [unclassified Bradyrhizobium]MCK1328785.1 glycosyltransferase family 8 protein [Bradyrhizobium sp. CW9]MCK1693439.1 glycosyltransferase family 8 protein [Bradyrhizobium sp. 144]